MTTGMSMDALQYDELDSLDAPSWESFYQGMLAGIGVVGIVVLAT